MNTYSVLAQLKSGKRDRKFFREVEGARFTADSIKDTANSIHLQVIRIENDAWFIVREEQIL